MNNWKKSSAPAARKWSGCSDMLKSISGFLVQEAHTRRSGIWKLLRAYLAAPVMAAALWAAPVACWLIMRGINAQIATAWSKFFMAYFYSFIAASVAGFVVGTIALVLSGVFFLKFRLFRLWYFLVYACLCVAVLLMLLSEGNSHTAISYFMNFGWVIAGGAMTIAFLFWNFGIKNNHWLLNR